MILFKLSTCRLLQRITTSFCKMSMSPKKRNLVWIDLEMTGLDLEQDHIIEIACIITDGNLNTIAQGPDLVIHQPDHVLQRMGDWCKTHHEKSGLTSAVQKSRISLPEAEQQVLSFIQKHTVPHTCPLAGNSVHADREFLRRYMPKITDYLHYRIVDVSTIKELCRRWYPDEIYRKENNHRALDDIRESINELRFYRQTIFKS